MKRVILSVLLQLGLIVTLAALPVSAQEVQSLLETPQARFPACEGLAFSTEEDFLTRGPVPPDGNALISDGDLLIHSPGGGAFVCARNRHLLQAFDVRPDLGLDAVDVLDARRFVIAFSTELDDPHGRFSAGDLLLTNGAVIPNFVLLAGFDLLDRRYDLGLDAVHFVGRREAVNELVRFLSQYKSRAQWEDSPERLRDHLARLQETYEKIDIWFSTEGTALPVHDPQFLDGDLLSALDGTVVIPQEGLLPPSVPAGLPPDAPPPAAASKGVDFGLDAVTGSRRPERESLFFSTEILFEDQPPFTDGDVLRQGNGVVIPNADLVTPFEPLARFLGLDALSNGRSGPDEPVPRITHIGQISVSDIDGGEVPVGGPGSGLASYTGYERPYGRWVPIYGDIPPGIDEYRVVYRLAGTSRPGVPANAPGIAVTAPSGWKADDWNTFLFDCSGEALVASDAIGWFDAHLFRRLRYGEGVPFNTVCNAQLALTVWNSFDATQVDTEGHYVVWLQWRTGAGPIQEETFDHHVQFDNQSPAELALEIPGSACTAYGPRAMPIMVQGKFKDPHFGFYRLRIFGGSPPAAHNYGLVYYDDSATDNVDGGGTIGSGLVDLHEVDVADLPSGSVVDCCYGIRLWAEDLTLVGGFTPASNVLPLTVGFWDITEITFSYDAP